MSSSLISLLGKRPNNGEFYIPREEGESPTRKIRRLTDNLRNLITYQTTVIVSTITELLEVKHDWNMLKAQIEELREKVRALRAQVDGLPRHLRRDHRPGGE